jgi:hypothetical protein
MMPPYHDNEITRPCQRRLNYGQKRTRVMIEQAFGQWKRRFAVLQSTCRTKLETAFSIIVACAVLHNIAKMNGLPDIAEGPTDEEINDDMSFADATVQTLEDGKGVRDYIADEFFSD